MKKVLLAFILLTGLLQTSCSSDLISESLPITNSVDVYVAGQKDNQACYWKNNQPFLLDSGGIMGPVANKIIVANDDVYVLGIGASANPLGAVPMFWKNGVLTILKTSLSTDAEEVMSITDFEVIGNDVYFVGYTRKTIVDFEDYSLFYWKNGIQTLVHNYGGYAQNQSRIKIANNNVYVTGTNSDNGNVSGMIDGYYTNSVFTEVPNSMLNGFSANNNEIFAFGTKDGISYYKNITLNSETTFPITPANGITDMYFDNGNMYFTDGSNNIYKNGILFDEGPISSGGIHDFKVLNDNIYRITHAGEFGFISFLTINGVQTMELPNGDGSFQSIYVVQN
ncbi:hypothetical protein J2X31_000908 [Flavobacterium arsenatis]|uniref:Lipoprotein n=1 Tax=Flavobacterium arsenatis TaxID=1484332 RepID=A0ABU1TNA8_9FLAO|nr:hypothetical protein [Flavobacterium arsenatis]MDR6966908.1 hypothetical protein [Flavobacterium arsenatis]